MSEVSTSPEVSVLMAAYNAEQYIAQAIESLLAQTLQNWELIVINDQSTDRTSEIIDAYAKRDSRIRCYWNQKNQGVGFTRQRALNLANGQYSAILDADDIALPEWLDDRVSYLENHPDVVLVSSSLKMIDEDNRYLGRKNVVISPLAIRWSLIFGNPIHDPSCVYRTKVAKDVGGYPDAPFSACWSLFSKLMSMGWIVQFTKPLMLYRKHASSVCGILGPKRNSIEELARSIIGQNLRRFCRIVPPKELTELIWYLFRGRYVFRGQAKKSQRASTLILQAYKAFAKQNDLEAQSAALVAAAMDDVVNVLRCGGWSPLQAMKAFISIVSCSGARTLLSPVVIPKGIKLLLAPVALPQLPNTQSSVKRQG